MIVELTDITGRPIDIVLLNAAPPLLCYQVTGISDAIHY